MPPDSTRTPTGTLQWPLPVAGTITSQFGHRVDPMRSRAIFCSIIVQNMAQLKAIVFAIWAARLRALPRRSKISTVPK